MKWGQIFWDALYIVEYDINVIDRKCNAGEKLIDGTCVWFGNTTAEFKMYEYTDATYTRKHPEQSNGTRTAGEMIYMGIENVCDENGLNCKLPADTQWGVETCWIIEQGTKHLFFDPTGSDETGLLIDGRSQSCSREHLKLQGQYSCRNPEFRFWFRLFMGVRGTSAQCERTPENPSKYFENFKMFFLRFFDGFKGTF